MNGSTIPLARRGVSFLAIVLAVGCGPYYITYKHVCIDESSNVKIIERSNSSTAPNGHPLHSPKVDLPLESLLNGNGYKIQIHTPLAPEALVFLDAYSNDGATLTLVGPNLVRIQHNYQYSFYVEEAKGSPISFSVIDSRGKLLGVEKVTYNIKSRGFTYGIESI